MASVGTRYLAHARADADGMLVEADDLVARLQRACGGAIGTRIAIPELLALVDKSLRFGLRLARQFEAVDGENRITAWVEIAPLTDADGKTATDTLIVSIVGDGGTGSYPTVVVADTTVTDEDELELNALLLK